MKQKFIQFLLAFFMIYCEGNGQIVSTEGFESMTYPPVGWSIKVNIPAPGTNVWIRQTAPITNPIAQPHSGTVVSRFRSRNVVAGTKQLLITRPIDYSSRDTSAAKLDFWMYRDSLLLGNVDSLTIWVNSTDSIDATAIKLGTIARNRSISIPDTQSVNAWYHFSYLIPLSFQGTTTHFIFEGTSQSKTTGQGANIYIDDVSFDEFPALCTGTPDVGTILKNEPIICGGGGAAVLGLTAPIKGLSGITYSWEDSTLLSGTWTSIGTNASVLNIPSLTSTTYFRCTVLCSFSSLSYTTPIDSILVFSNPPPKVLVSPSRDSFCAGTSGVQLIASGAVGYVWTPSTGLNSTTGDTVIASPTINMQYFVRGTDSIGCWDTAVANVVVNSLPLTNITEAPNDSVCAGTRVILTSIGNAPNGYTYLWSNGSITRRDTITVTTDTTLSVNVISASGCSKADTITILSFPLSVAKFGYSSSVNTFDFTDSSIAAVSWKWHFGDGDSSTIQNPTHTYAIPGIYKVTLLIKSFYCNDDSISVIVMSGPICFGNPDVGSIQNTTPIVCEGSDATLNLTAAIVGLSGITYTWEESNSPNGPWTPLGLNSISLNIVSLKATTYYHCITSCSFSSLSYTTPVDSIVALPLPSVLATPASASICVGESGLQLIATGAITYTWTPNTGLNTTVGDTVIATPTISTFYIVTGIGPNGCSDTARVNITVNPLPATNITALPNDTVCKRTQVVLTAIPGGGAGNTYLWSNGKTARRDTILVSSDTTLSVNVINAAGCSKADTITIKSLIANFGYSNVSNAYSFSDSSANAISWKWTFGDGNTSSIEDPMNTYLTSGSYTVTLIVSNGLCSDTISKVIQVAIVGIADISGVGQLNYYPNPVFDNLNIDLKNQVVDAISITNTIGQNVLRYSNTYNSISISIPTQSLHSGIYFAELSVNGKRYKFKFVKE